MSKKDLADLLGTSASYITQIFRGHKTINLRKLAELQELFGIEFDIKLKAKIKQKGKRSTPRRYELKSRQIFQPIN